jgi:MFS family permease
MTGLKVKSFFQDFQEVLKEKNLRRILLMNVIRRISMVMSSPFVYLWMVNVKSADPSILGIVGFLGLIVYALFQLPAGIIADKIGRKKAFILLESFRYIGTIWLIISPTPAQLIVAGILGACGLTSGAESSGIGGASFVPWMVLNWEIVPEEKRGRWYGIISFMSFLNIFVGLCAGVMWEAGLMVQVLILPLILEVCFVLPLLLTTPETHQLAALD